MDGSEESGSKSANRDRRWVCQHVCHSGPRTGISHRLNKCHKRRTWHDVTTTVVGLKYLEMLKDHKKSAKNPFLPQSCSILGLNWDQLGSYLKDQLGLNWDQGHFFLNHVQSQLVEKNALDPSSIPGARKGSRVLSVRSSVAQTRPFMV